MWPALQQSFFLQNVHQAKTRYRAVTRYSEALKHLSSIPFMITTVLHGMNPKLAGLYASKALQNIKFLLKTYPSCYITLYYDHTTPRKFLEHINHETRVTLVFVKHSVGQSVMLSRFLRFDTPKTEWTFTLDIHEELPLPQHSKMLRDCIPRDDFTIAVLWWPPDKTNFCSRDDFYRKRNPCVVLDAGGIGLHRKHSLGKITPYIHEFLRKNHYEYGDDEKVFDRFLKKKHPTWYDYMFYNPDMYKLIGDTESHMRLDDAIIINATPPNGDDTRFADEIIDWTRFQNSSTSMQTHYKIQNNKL